MPREDLLDALDHPLRVQTLRLEILHDIQEIRVRILLIAQSFLQLFEITQRLLFPRLFRGLRRRGAGPAYPRRKARARANVVVNRRAFRRITPPSPPHRVASRRSNHPRPTHLFPTSRHPSLLTIHPSIPVPSRPVVPSPSRHRSVGRSVANSAPTRPDDRACNFLAVRFSSRLARVDPSARSRRRETRRDTRRIPPRARVLPIASLARTSSPPRSTPGRHRATASSPRRLTART